MISEALRCVRGDFGDFSTPHSNGTNKVIDTACTFLLSSAVYIEAHSRRSAAFASRMNLRDAANAASSRSLQSFNFFTFNGFRTLSRNGGSATPLLSNASALFPLQWGCIPPLYFRLIGRPCAPRAQNQRTNCAFFRSKFFACHTCVFHGGEGVHILTNEGGATNEGQVAGLKR
jgi:hypothetical protein